MKISVGLAEVVRSVLQRYDGLDENGRVRPDIDKIELLLDNQTTVSLDRARCINLVETRVSPTGECADAAAETDA